jgi:hypothetical protein
VSGIRIGGAMQSANARAATVFAYSSAAAASKVQLFVEQLVTTAQTSFPSQLKNVLVSLLTPVSVLALVFGLWRVSEDLGWAEAFLIPSGFFSHWQVWIALAIGLRLAASSLQARAKTSEES